MKNCETTKDGRMQMEIDVQIKVQAGFELDIFFQSNSRMERAATWLVVKSTIELKERWKFVLCAIKYKNKKFGSMEICWNFSSGS